MATLYASEDRKRFFWVPDDARLPPGDLVVRSLSGKKLAADPVALDVYEIPEDEAMRRAQEVLGGFADSVRAVAMSAAKALGEPRKLDPDAVKAREERVAGYLKMSREQFRSDPAAVGSAIKAALDGLASVAKEAVETPEAAKERLADVAEALRQEGVTPPEALETLPDKLRELLASEDTIAKLDAAAAELRKAAAALRDERERKLEN